MRTLSIRSLLEIDGPALSAMLNANSREYQQYFYPFSFDEQTIRQMLGAAKKDKYWGMWIDDHLVAFFMLRGFDAGYAIPSYGVCVAESYQGRGLLKLSLQFVCSWCRLNNIPKLMLKVHPHNSPAKRTYERFGFEQTGVDSKNNHLIYHYTF
jgi:RimJ/RimL family protein N-acetyltransferase